MPHRLFEAIEAQDLIRFDELLSELRPGPLTALRDGEGRSLLEAAEDAGLLSEIRERLFEHSLEARGVGGLMHYLAGLDEEAGTLASLVGSDDPAGGSDAEMDGGAPDIPYVPSEQETVAARAVAALGDSPNLDHQNLAVECVCLITGQPFVPSVEALAPIKLPDFPGASGSVISRGAARRLLAAERDPIFGSRVPTDPVTRRPLDAKAILDSEAFMEGDVQRTAMVNAVLEAFAESCAAGIPEQCRRAHEAARAARAKAELLASPDYRDAAARAAVGGLRDWRAVKAGTRAEAVPRRSFPEPGSPGAAL